MKRIYLISLIVLLLLSSTLSYSIISTSMRKPKRETVKNVDLNRYVGKWYEIARFPHSFEKNLQGVTATYTLLPNGKISVLNEGYENNLNGKHKVANGKARIIDASNAGYLQVSFFLWFYADYYIMELDTVNYQYSLVGSQSADYLWILSRTPKMDESTFKMLTSKAESLGYDLSKLQLVEQAAE